MERLQPTFGSRLTRRESTWEREWMYVKESFSQSLYLITYKGIHSTAKASPPMDSPVSDKGRIHSAAIV